MQRTNRAQRLHTIDLKRVSLFGQCNTDVVSSEQQEQGYLKLQAITFKSEESQQINVEHLRWIVVELPCVAVALAECRVLR